MLISKHVLFKVNQKYLSLVINCLSCCMNWYSWGYHSQFGSYPYTFSSYSYGCKILQPCVSASVRMHSDVVLSSTGALLMTTVLKHNRRQQMVHFCFGRIRLPDTCESAFNITCYNSAKPPETSKSVRKRPKTHSFSAGRTSRNGLCN